MGAGQSLAPDRPRVTVAPVADVEWAYPYLHPREPVRAIYEAILRVQLLTGMRPGELCRLTPGQLDRTADVWVYAPAGHKNRHRGKRRAVDVGPRHKRLWLRCWTASGRAIRCSPTRGRRAGRGRPSR